MTLTDILLIAVLLCLVIAIRQLVVVGRSIKRVRQMQQRAYWVGGDPNEW